MSYPLSIMIRWGSVDVNLKVCQMTKILGVIVPQTWSIKSERRLILPYRRSLLLADRIRSSDVCA